MRRLPKLLAIAALVGAGVPAIAHIAVATAPDQPGQPVASRIVAGTYQVDPNHTQVAWQVNHLGISMLDGLFPVSAGTLTIDPARPAAARVDVTIAVDQIAVTSAGFSTHLKSDQIFDAARYPTARFVSTAVTPQGNGKATVAGQLTIKGVTKPVTLDASFFGAGTNPQSHKFNVGFRATANVKRSDFGVALAAPAVSDTVALTINAAFIGS